MYTSSPGSGQSATISVINSLRFSEPPLTTRSADPRQRVADQKIDDPGAPESGLEQNQPRRIVGYPANHRRSGAQWMRLQRGHCGVRRVGIDDHHDPSLTGNVERVDAQQLAGPADLRAYRDGLFLDHHGNARSRGDFVEDGRDATTGGIAHRPDV